MKLRDENNLFKPVLNDCSRVKSVKFSLWTFLQKTLVWELCLDKPRGLFVSTKTDVNEIILF